MSVLVGYVDTPEGRAALDAAIAEARRRDGTLIVTHATRAERRQEDDEMARTRQALDKVAERLEGEGVDYEIRDLIRGRSVTDSLVEFASEEQVDLLVIGIRRRSPVGKLVLGSHAQDILLHADCPVLAVKADRGQAAPSA